MNDNILLIIDPGHGGSDGGAAAFGYKEKELNLEISLELKLLAREYFPNILMTRENDKYIDLNTRAKWVAAEAEKFLKTHLDGKVICLSEHNNACNGQGRGCETIHSIHSDPALANSIARKITELGIPLRRVFSRESANTKGADYYCMHRRTGRAKTVIIESFFVDNAHDVQFLKQPGFIPALARKHLEGLLNYLQVPQKQTIVEAPVAVIEPPKPEFGEEAYTCLKKMGMTINETRFKDPLLRGEAFALFVQLKSEIEELKKGKVE